MSHGRSVNKSSGLFASILGSNIAVGSSVAIVNGQRVYPDAVEEMD
jgi:hypothetical protein